jgi:P27 family predicted phage terminase small subunit
MRKLPTHLKLLRGNPGKRAIQPEPEPAVPGTPPEPPAFLGEDAKNEWFRVVPELQRLGLLTVVDLMPLAAYCDAFSRWVTAERLLTAMADKDATTKALLLKGAAGNAVANPLVKLARCAAADMVHFAGEFGMTPLARSRLNAPKRAASGKFGDLLT